MLTTAGFLLEIPIKLSSVIGDIVIRFGQLERALITAHARTSDSDDMECAIAKLKESGSMLGLLIKKLETDIGAHNFTWINFDNLRSLAEKRNGVIHDSLIEENGELRWQSNAERRHHRPVDYDKLILLRDSVTRTILEINSGSLKDKKVK